MGLNTIVLVNFMIMLVILVMVITLMLRLKRLEDKFVDVTPKDVATYVEQMREILIESERAAELLDTAIREREATLEDLNDLVEGKISRLNDLAAYQDSPPIDKLPAEKAPLQNKVYRLLLQGHSEENIAKQLGISVPEINMIINMVKE